MQNQVDIRFLEIIKEMQTRAESMIVHPEILKRGPYWVSLNGPTSNIKNRFGDVMISNIKRDEADEVAELLNSLNKPSTIKMKGPN